MMKRILCYLLCIVLLATTIPISVQAEDIAYYLISIDAGNGVQTEKAIIEDDEIYIAAQSFAKYTRYEYNEDSHRFLIEGQEADKAFKRILVNAEMKRVVVDSKQIDLKNSFVIDGVPYLPFCQMLPILNADIIDVDSGVIQIVNNELSMAELLYDFDIHDYWFNLSQEFFDSEFWMFLHIAPSYLLDTIVNFKWKRVDFVFNSGTREDYESIFTEYLKDDALFHKAMSEVDDTGDLLECITGLNGISQKLNDVYEWFDKIEAVDYEPLKSDKLIQFLQKSSGGGDYIDEMESIIRAANEDVFFDKVSYVDIWEGIDYLYFYLNQVEDNRQMLDAVYDVGTVSGESELFVTVDPEALAARKIYELYSGDIIPAVTKKVVEEGAEKLIEDHSAFKTLELIKLTAKLTGEIAEIFLQGESSERAMLLNHFNIALSGLSKCSIPKLDTEESTENYRLSLLLTLIASRRGYQILSEVLPEEYAKQKIESIENLIMGLYLVAGNVAFDTYENYDDFAEQNRNAVRDAGIFQNPVEYTMGQELLTSIEYGILLSALKDAGIEDIEWDLADSNHDGRKELYIDGVTTGWRNSQIFYDLETGYLWSYTATGAAGDSNWTRFSSEDGLVLENEYSTVGNQTVGYSVWRENHWELIADYDRWLEVVGTNGSEDVYSEKAQWYGENITYEAFVQHETNTINKNYTMACPNLMNIELDNSLSQVQALLDARFRNSEELLAIIDQDLDKDGIVEHLYLLQGVANKMLENMVVENAFGDEKHLNYVDDALTIISTEENAGKVLIRILRTTHYSLEDGILQINSSQKLDAESSTQEERYKINVFLSNFSEQWFGDYSIENSDPEQLISFAFLWYLLNDQESLAFTDYHVTLTLDQINKKVDRYFGLTISADEVVHSGYNMQDNRIAEPYGIGESYPDFTVANEIIDNGDGTYLVQFKIYSLKEAMSGGNRVTEKKWYYLTEEDASKSFALEYYASGHAIVKPYQKGSIDSYQLITYCLDN